VKKALYLLLFVGLIMTSEGLFAAGMDENPNQSVNYIRTGKRNAATDAADAAYYNPAGTVKLADGLHLNVGTQYVVRKHEHEAAGTTYTDEGPVFFPNLHAVWKQDNWAGFFSFTIPGGGGWSTFEDGTVVAPQLIASGLLLPLNTIESQRVDGFSYYLGFSAGGAYSINEYISFGAGARYIHAMKEAYSRFTLSISSLPGTFTSFKTEYKDTANGAAGFFSLNVTPMKNLVIAIKYQMKTILEFEKDVEKDDTGFLEDGSKYRRDLPAQAGIGIAYKINPALMVEVDANYYFTKDAAWEGEQHKWDNAYDAGFAVEYAIIPQLKASVGLGYSWQNAKGDDANDSPDRYANPYLDVWAVSGGLGYTVMEGLTVNTGLIRSFFQNETTAAGVKVKRETWLVGLGVDYRVL